MEQPTSEPNDETVVVFNENVIQQLKCFKHKYRVWVVHVNSRFSLFTTTTSHRVRKYNMKTLIHKRKTASRE